MQFHRLGVTPGGLVVNSKKPFPHDAQTFKPATIKKVFDFAFDMTFGDRGEHRDHRTGGTAKRKKGEIFANTFQGKLAECAACNLLYKIDTTVFPDFSISKLGIWDSVDVVVQGKKIAVKSTKSFGNLLLLEQHDWDEQANYIPNRDGGVASYDYFLLIRIKPFCEDIMRTERWLYTNDIDRDLLWQSIQKLRWSYDCAGYISAHELRYIISNRYVLPKGATLNGGTRIDADNYYVQAGDMHDISELLMELAPNPQKEAQTAIIEKVDDNKKTRRKWYEFIFNWRK